jgi:1,4-dihydroxy-2-naphthoyl-CoA synthase
MDQGQTKLYAIAVQQVIEDRYIEVEIKEQVAIVTFNRPKVRNAMTLNMWRAIPGIFKGLESDPQVRAIILCGADRDFCVGADIAEFSQVRKDIAQAKEYEVAVDACCDAIFDIKKPTLAAIKG